MVNQVRRFFLNVVIHIDATAKGPLNQAETISLLRISTETHARPVFIILTTFVLCWVEAVTFMHHVAHNASGLFLSKTERGETGPNFLFSLVAFNHCTATTTATTARNARNCFNIEIARGVIIRVDGHRIHICVRVLSRCIPVSNYDIVIFFSSTLECFVVLIIWINILTSRTVICNQNNRTFFTSNLD